MFRFLLLLVVLLPSSASAYTCFMTDINIQDCGSIRRKQPTRIAVGYSPNCNVSGWIDWGDGTNTTTGSSTSNGQGNSDGVVYKENDWKGYDDDDAGFGYMSFTMNDEAGNDDDDNLMSHKGYLNRYQVVFEHVYRNAGSYPILGYVSSIDSNGNSRAAIYMPGSIDGDDLDGYRWWLTVSKNGRCHKSWGYEANSDLETRDSYDWRLLGWVLLCCSQVILILSLLAYLARKRQRNKEERQDGVTAGIDTPFHQMIL